MSNRIERRARHRIAKCKRAILHFSVEVIEKSCMSYGEPSLRKSCEAVAGDVRIENIDEAHGPVAVFRDVVS